MNERMATKLLMANLKGSKKKKVPLTEMAEAIRYLNIKKNKTFDEMSRLFDVSKYMLFQINKINELNDSSKTIIKNGELGIEQSYLLSKFKNKRQDAVAKELKSMNAHESRKFVNLLLVNENLSVLECKKIFEEKILKKFSMVVIPMPENMYRKLVFTAKKSKKNVHDFAYSILENYLNER